MSGVGGIADAVAAGRASARSTVADALERIVAREQDMEGLNAFVAIDPERALACADGIDDRIARGETLPLAGVPVALKDNICTTDLPTTCASRILDGYVSPYDATVVRRLRAAGAIIIGKNNLDEFAMGSATMHSMFGRTLHPADPARVPGGSSGGSAAAVAAALVPVALGSDTGGSVRQPAAFCGVVGVKPTYGRVSRYGLVGFASSLDHIGVFGATVLDAALVLQVIAGPDPFDATSAVHVMPDLAAACVAGVRGLRVGVVRAYVEAAERDAANTCDTAIDALRAQGALICDVELGGAMDLVEPYRVLSSVEAVTNLARFDGVRFGVRAAADDFSAMRAATRSAGIGPAVRARLAYGEAVLAEDQTRGAYADARSLRERVCDRMRAVFNDVDVLLTPATPSPAFALADADATANHDSDAFLLAANLAGVPALSVPFGRSAGLPLGVQLIAPWWHEHVMLAAAAVLEASSQS